MKLISTLTGVALVATVLNCPLPTRAASHTWSGAVNGYWNNAGNWSSGGVPTLAETNSLVFPSGATRTTITNDIGALKVSVFNFSGSNYVVRGASTITVMPSLLNLLCNNSNTVESALTFSSGFTVTVGEGDSLVLSGQISGAGGLVKLGTGDLYLRGGAANSFSGGLTVNYGAVYLAKTGGATAVPGPLTIVGTTNFGEIASVRLSGSEQISGSADVLIHPTGLLNLLGFTNSINHLTVMAGTVYEGVSGSLLRLNGNLNLSAQDNAFPTPDLSPLIQGNLEFLAPTNTITVSNLTCEIEANIVEYGTTTTLVKEGPGTLALKGGGNNPGAWRINTGTVISYAANSLGTVVGGTVVANGATLEFRPGYISSEPLTLTGLGEGGLGALRLFGGSMTHLGPISVTNETAVGVTTAGDILDLSGVISGAGGIRKVGDGQLRFNGASANTFSGASFVDRGQLTLNKSASIRAIGSVTVTNGAQLVLNANEQIDNAGTLSIYAGGGFNMTNRNESVGGLNLGGNYVLETGTGTLTLLGALYAGSPYTTNFLGSQATIRGNLSLGGGTRPMQENGCNIVLDCHVSDGAGMGGIHLLGGFLYLVRSNSFTGPVFVDGNCTISNNFAFGAASGGVFATNAPGHGSMIRLAAPAVSVAGETLTCWSGLELYAQGTNAWNGPIITPASNYFFSTFAPPGAQLTIDGHISGTNGLYAEGQGLLRLMQSNSYAGKTILSGGAIWNATVAIRHPHSLGTTAQGTEVGEGAKLRLELPHGAVVQNESLLYAYNGYTDNTNNWLIVHGAVSNTWSGPVTFNIPVKVDVLDADGVFALNAGIGGSGALEKRGPGTLLLGGTDPNTYPGNTLVADGTLRLNKPNGVQATTNLIVNFPAQLRWGGSEQIADAATLRLNDADAYLTNHNETITHLALVNGNSSLGASGGALTLLGDVDLHNSTIFGNYNSISATMRLGPGAHLIFNANTDPWAGGSQLNVWGSIQETGGNGGLTITNCGVTLHGSNSFTGPVVVDDAFLTLRHPNGLGGTGQGTLLTNSGALDLAMPSGSVVVGESLVLAPPAAGAGDPSMLTMFGEYTNTWAGPVTLLESNQVLITAGSKLTIDGPVLGPAALYAISAELVLTGAQTNTISGLVVDGGTVRLAKSAGVPAFLGDLTLNPEGSPFAVTPTVILDAPGQFLPQTTASVSPGGTNAVLNLNGQTATIKRLLGGGQVQIGTGMLTISNSLAQYSDFMGTLQSAPGGTLLHQGAGTQRGGTFALNGAALLQSGTMYFDGGYIGALDISAGAILDMYSTEAHFGSLSGAGKIITSSGVTYVGANHNSTTFAGVIEGSSGTNIIKVGTGALTLTGANTDTGKTVVRNGALLVNGSLAGPVSVESIGAPNFAILGGTGQVGHVTVSGIGSVIAPGATTNTPSYGRLRVGSFTLGTGGDYRGEIGGTNAGVDLDQIDAAGTVNLTGGFADFTAFGAGATSNRYAVVKSVSPVSGTFLGDPEGDYIFPAAGRFMVITYLTAGGQEIALIEQAGTPVGNFSVTGITSLTNGHISLVGTGAPSVAYFVLANTNLGTTNWENLGQVTGHAFDGSFSFTDTNAPSFPQRFYRFRLQ